MSARSGWSTQQLTEFVAVVSQADDEQRLVLDAVEHVVEAVEAIAGSILVDGHLAATYGFPASYAAGAHIAAVANGITDTIDVPGAGTCAVVIADCDRLAATSIVVVRGEPFSAEESGLVRAMVRVLGLRLDAVRTLDAERRARVESERQAEQNAQLAASLQERQTLLERLAHIQRSISSRQALTDVLDDVVAAAAELLGDEVAVLRLRDLEQPELMVMPSAVGVPSLLAVELHRKPIGTGVAGVAIAENRMVVAEDYAADPHARRAFLEDGILSGMAAPVRRGDVAVGALLVATRRPGRTYSASEREVLQAFADHAALAISDARTLEQLHTAVARATYESLHDPLTSLPNRAGLLSELGEAADRARRRGSLLSLLFIDVDNFKLVNDSLGHVAGDQLLCTVAMRLQGCVRDGDVVARLSGDEFAVVLPGSDGADAVVVGERILEALAAPIPLVRGATVSASIGVLTVSAPDETPEGLLRDADVAMYRAKAAGKGRLVVFEPSMRQDMQDRIELEADLRDAVTHGWLHLVYQPIVDVASGAIVSAEALLRWNHPTRGPIPAEETIGLAEDCGLLESLGAWVLEAACREAAAWRRTPSMAHVSVGVNVSASQLNTPGLALIVESALASARLPAAALTLEITESVLLRHLDVVLSELNRLKAHGVTLAVDDFGTGYSSLSYLASLPFDVLKVDRIFVAQALSGERGGALAAAVLALADSLNLVAVAEGVETLGQWDHLRRLGCRYAQGYLFSRPVSADALRELAEGGPIDRVAAVPSPRRPHLVRSVTA